MIRPDKGILDHAVTKSVSGGAERVSYRWINLAVVLSVVPFPNQSQLEQIHDFRTQHYRQEFPVSDVLNDGIDDFPGLLVELLVAPMGIEFGQRGGRFVVESHPDGMHGRQTRLFVDAAVPGAEAFRGEGSRSAKLASWGVRGLQGALVAGSPVDYST